MSKKQQKEEANQLSAEPSALRMQAQDLMFYRRLLGTEKIPAQFSKMRSEYIYGLLVPALKAVDEKIKAIREELASRNPDGSIKSNEDGSYEYGENEDEATQRKQEVLSEYVVLPIENINIHNQMKNVFINTRQELNEYEGYFYSKICSALEGID